MSTVNTLGFTRIGVVGLGYVGLPLIVQLAKNFNNLVGFDLNEKRVEELTLLNLDSNEDVSHQELDAVSDNIIYTTDENALSGCNFIIVAVPTPITAGNKPDQSYLESASRKVGRTLKKGDTVVFESTVYPGMTEEVCVPIIEKVSHLKCGEDWYVGYSPERVNPADKVNTIDRITKVVSGMDQQTLELVNMVYSTFTTTHKATSIKVAEAAKVIENSQRDLNIAFVNELSLIFDKLGIDTLDVLEAAGTKWNFLKFQPGLVGGHCISVDPFYLTYKAEDSGVISQVIMAGRRVNDSMPGHIVNLTSRALNSREKAINGSKVLIMGATFKENCPDVRNSKVENIIDELQTLGAEVEVYDPYYIHEEIPFHKVRLKGIGLFKGSSYDAIILAVPHAQIVENYNVLAFTKVGRHPPIIDIKGVLGKGEDVIRL